MTNCQCQIDCDVGDYEYEEIRSQTVTAKRNYKCCECNDLIPAGMEHRIDVMRGDWGAAPFVDVYRTCQGCYSVRKSVFCNFQFEMLWENLADYISDGGEISEACLCGMTPTGREEVCEMIEEQWRKDSEEGDDL